MATCWLGLSTQRMRVRRFKLEALALVTVAGVLALSAGASAAASARTVSVFFLRGEQLAGVPREGSGVAVAVRRLLAGPTRAEARSGFRTYVPSGTKVHSLVVANDIATVDLSASFTSGDDSGDRLARLAQLIRTVSTAGATRVQLLIDGAKVSGVFPARSDGTADHVRAAADAGRPGAAAAPRRRALSTRASS
jgi:hypothetical protein